MGLYSVEVVELEVFYILKMYTLMLAFIQSSLVTAANLHSAITFRPATHSATLLNGAGIHPLDNSRLLLAVVGEHLVKGRVVLTSIR